MLEATLQRCHWGAREKGLGFQVIVDADVPGLVVGDSVRLGQVLLNLVGNATKFTATGSITVRVRKQSVDGEEICLCLSVSDTGIGVAKRSRSHL